MGWATERAVQTAEPGCSSREPRRSAVPNACSRPFHVCCLGIWSAFHIVFPLRYPFSHVFFFFRHWISFERMLVTPNWLCWVMSMPGCLYYTMLCYKAPTLPWKQFASFERGQMAAAFRARLSLFWSFGPVPHAAQSMGVMKLFHIDQQRQKWFPVLGECMDCFFIWCFLRIPAFLCLEGLPQRLSGASCGSLRFCIYAASLAFCPVNISYHGFPR